MTKPGKLNTQIYEEATDWFVEFRTGDVDTAARADFNNWLQTSPEHVRAYLEIAAIWNEGPALDPERTLNDETLLARIASEGNVVPLEKVPRAEVSGALSRSANDGLAPSVEASRPHSKKRPRYFLIAASLLMTIGLATGYYTQRGLYETGIGEQRSLVLADGSTVELNSRSRIRIRFEQNERNVELLEGQALFRVAKDHARPFIVTADSTRVRAVGTQFDVYKKRSGTVVTVVEGRVAISSTEASIAGPEPAFSAGALVSAGEQLTATPISITPPRPVDVSTATAWTERQIVFESASLAEVADEFNRYNIRQLIVDDAALADVHISGVFSSADPAALVRFLRQRRSLHIIETEHEIRISKE